MANSFELLLVIGGALAASFGKSFSSASKSVGGLNKSVNQGHQMLAKLGGLVAGYATVDRIVDFGKESVAAYNEAASAAQRLNTTMLNVKGTTPAMVESIKNYANALEETTAIDKDLNLVAASQLATFGAHQKNIQQLLPYLDNMAVAQYGVGMSAQQMQDTANRLGKVLAGNGGSLSEYGIMLSKSQLDLIKNGTEAQRTALLINVLKNKYGDLAANMAQTPAGQVQKLKNAWDDVKEEIGGQLTPVVTQAMNVIGKNLPKIKNGAIEAVKGLTPVLNFVKDTVLPGLGTGFQVVGNILGWFGRNAKAIAPIIWGIVAAVVAYKTAQLALVAAQKVGMIIQTLSGGYQIAATAIGWLREGESLATVAQILLNTAMAANPALMIAAALMVLVGVGVLIVKNWDHIKIAAKALWTVFKAIFSALLMPVIGIPLLIVKNWDKIVGYFKQFWGWIRPYVQPFIDFAQLIIDKVKAAIDWLGKLFGMNGEKTISVSGGGSGGPGPTTVQAYARGGIVPARPGGTLIRAGEGRQDEAIVPLPARGFGNTSFTYSPQIVVQGTVAREDMARVLEDDRRKFAQQMRQWMKDQGRISLSAGRA